MEPLYKPVIPQWVADILVKKREGNPHAVTGHRKEWDEWKYRYSRKYKYALRNGWIVEGSTEDVGS